MSVIVSTMGLTDGVTATSDEEAQLVAAAQRGDGDAYGQLVRRHQQRVFRLAGRFFRRPEEVEEAAQETFVRAWEKLATYRGAAPFEHWLTRVCLNCCYARFRARSVEEVPLELERGEQPADPTARLEIERLLDRLRREDRFLLLLLHGEGWSVAEIAERLGWSRANVKVRAHRARRRLRRILEEDAR
jgi:RNA polymerase sigma-70 factor (ECF subfamily)